MIYLFTNFVWRVCHKFTSGTWIGIGSIGHRIRVHVMCMNYFLRYHSEQDPICLILLLYGLRQCDLLFWSLLIICTNVLSCALMHMEQQRTLRGVEFPRGGGGSSHLPPPIHRWLMMPKSSPMRCTILALVAVAYKREQHKNTFRRHRCGAGQTPFEG